MSVRKFFEDYFYFSRRDRVGLAVLLLLIAFVYALPYLFPKKTDFDLQSLPMVAAEVDSSNENVSTRGGSYAYDPSLPSLPARVFPFDPNALDVKGWISLGLREKTAQTILKYRSRGGQFRRPEDLQKIWGLPKGFYERVKDYIRIEKTIVTPSEKDEQSTPPPFQREAKKPLLIDINTADSAAWEALPGIGARLASRIVLFRQKLGGFVDVAQVAEVYGLADSVYEKIRPMLQGGGAVRKININTATQEALQAHPYFRWKGANAVIAYREQHGFFKSVDDLEKIGALDAGMIRKMKVYVVVE